MRTLAKFAAALLCLLVLAAPATTSAWRLPKLVDAKNKVVGEMIGPDMVLIKINSTWFGLPVNAEGFENTNSLKLLYELPGCQGAPYIRAAAPHALMIRADGDNSIVTTMGILYYPDQSVGKQITVMSAALMNNSDGLCESARYTETVSRISSIRLDETRFSTPFRIK